MGQGATDEVVDRLLSGPRPPVPRPKVYGLDSHRLAGLRIPPDPAPLLPKPTVPQPPLLELTWVEERCVEELRRVYVSCATHRFKRRLPGVPAGGSDLRAWKHYGALAHAVGIMRAEGVAPVPWVGWGFDSWAEMGNDGPPPVAFVFAAARFARLGWFRKEAGRYSPRGAPQVREAVELRQRHSLLLARLQLTPPGQGDVVVDEVLPEAEYRRLLEKAKQRANAVAAEWNLRVDRGEWLW